MNTKGLREMGEKSRFTRREFVGGLASLAVGAGLARLGGAQPARARRDRPNILFVFTDQQRLDDQSAAGNPSVRTPAMDGVAQEGVRFTRSFCSTPQCSPSRSSMLTGRWPHSTGVITNTEAIGARPLDPKIPSAGNIFSAAGYETAWFGKWHLGKDPRLHGFAAVDQCQGGEGELTSARAVEFLGQKRDRPFALFASFINPHDIYGFRETEKKLRLGERKIVLPASRGDDLRAKPAPQRRYRDEDQGMAAQGFTDEDWRRFLDVYYDLTEKVDGELGRLFDALRRRKLDRETIVVFTSDHGELGGAHGLCFKGPCMYRELVEVPLAICGPGVTARGRVCDELVSNVDLLPTLCELAGVAAPEGVQGATLRPLLEGRTPERWREFVAGEYYSKQRWATPIRMLQTKRWKYVRYRRWGEELYDLERDPGEVNNLAWELPASGEARETRDRMAAQLDGWMRETKDNFEELEPTDRNGQPIGGGGAPAGAPAKKRKRKKA